MTDTMLEIEETAKDVAKFVNTRGGCSLYGWYKRGEIKNASNIDLNDQMRVASGAINFHLVYPRSAQNQNQAQINIRMYSVEEMQNSMR